MEQLGIDKRVAGPQAVADEQREANDRGGDAQADAARGPSPIVHLHDREGQRADPTGNQQRGPRIGARHVVPRHLRQFPPADRQRHHTDGDVDQKDPAPARHHQQAAGDRPQCRGETADGRPGSHRAAAVFRGKRRQDQPDGCRRHQRRARCLYHPERDQHLDTIGRRTGGRGSGKQPDAKQKALIAAVTFGQAPEEHQQRRIGDRVTVQDPGQVFQ